MWRAVTAEAGGTRLLLRPPLLPSLSPQPWAAHQSHSGPGLVCSQGCCQLWGPGAGPSCPPKACGRGLASVWRGWPEVPASGPSPKGTELSSLSGEQTRHQSGGRGGQGAGLPAAWGHSVSHGLQGHGTRRKDRGREMPRRAKSKPEGRGAGAAGGESPATFQSGRARSPFPHLLFCAALGGLEDAHPRWGGVCSTQPTDSHTNLTQNHPHRHAQLTHTSHHHSPRGRGMARAWGATGAPHSCGASEPHFLHL